MIMNNEPCGLKHGLWGQTAGLTAGSACVLAIWPWTGQFSKITLSHLYIDMIIESTTEGSCQQWCMAKCLAHCLLYNESTHPRGSCWVGWFSIMSAEPCGVCLFEYSSAGLELCAGLNVVSRPCVRIFSVLRGRKGKTASHPAPRPCPIPV